MGASASPFPQPIFEWHVLDLARAPIAPSCISILRVTKAAFPHCLSALRPVNFAVVCKSAWPNHRLQPTSYADGKRGDGSPRNPRFNHGMHAGLDIPTPEGTPILAIADGVVVAKKEETPDGIGGIGIIVQHAPADTGYSVWLYTRYKHLKEMPALDIGARVKLGQKIADTGTSGTSGRYYGSGGHSHLHLDLFVSPDDKYFSGEVVFFPINGQVADPLAIFRGEPMDTASVRKLPADQKKAVIPYMTESGKIMSGSKARVIWPYACKPAGNPS